MGEIYKFLLGEVWATYALILLLGLWQKIKTGSVDGMRVILASISLVFISSPITVIFKILN